MSVTKNLIILLIVFSLNNVSGQINYKLSGFVRDKISGEVLIGATLIESGTGRGIITDNNGYFSLLVSIPTQLQVSYLGYKKILIDYDQKSDSLIHVWLVPGSEIDEVAIKAHNKPKVNVSNLSRDQILTIPSMGAKPDISRTLQLLPGIASQNEGSSLMLVRGGDPGQNLYLFDDVPVIHVNHLGGFFSVFNPEIINNIDVYKGAFPPRYGGKLSSIVDITQKAGDMSGHRGTFSIGITDASFSVEGPLLKRKSSYILTGRKTMIDPIMALVSKLAEGNDYIISYGFHDLNGKFSFSPNETNYFSLNFYQGDDYLNYWSDSKNFGENDKYRLGNFWGNWLVSGKWTSVVSPVLFSSTSISYTRYRLKEFMRFSIKDISDTVNYKRKYLSSVQELSMRTAWKYNAASNWSLDFGLQSSYLSHLPNSFIESTNSSGTNTPPIRSMENTFHLNNTVKFLKNSELKAGIRLMGYTTEGYSKISPEPRVNIDIELNPKNILNASYMRVSQFSHLIFTTGNISKNEIWVPSGKNIPPATSNQYTLGWTAYPYKNISADVNLYYKTMTNLSAYKDGITSLMGDEDWISKVESGGTGESKGMEFLLRLNTGKLSGFAAYTISRTTRQFPDKNRGESYLFDYDRLHNLSLNTSVKLNEKFTISGSWIFMSGLPFTPPIGKQLTPSFNSDYEDVFYYEAIIYGEKNSERMKPYHRMDLGINFTTLTKYHNKAVWSFSVYNAYNRRNAYFYYLNYNQTSEILRPEWGEGLKNLKMYQLSLFPIIPTISYKVYFNKDNPKEKQPFKKRLENFLYL